MRVHSPFVIFIGLFISQLSFGAACPVSSTSTSVGSAFNTNCTVTGSASTIQLNFDNGFSDATVISAVGGNNGTSIGAQRKLSFIKAAEILADQVVSSEIIIVDADFDAAMPCDASSATLGSAGATSNSRYSTAPSGLLDNTFYPIGLINAIRNLDVDAGKSDITAAFNADLGDANCLSGSFWYYGFDSPSAGNIGFTTVLLHEMTHGLGFASLTDASDGTKADGYDDIFSNNLYSQANSASWPGLTNGQREASAISTTGLLWNGSNVNTQAVGLLSAGFQNNDGDPAFTSGDRVQMYAPNPVEGGSSVSHFNTAASPDEIMEPQYTEGQLGLGLALYLLQDIGWAITPVANNAPTITAVDQSTNEDVAKVVDVTTWGNDIDGDSLTYSITACPANISCAISGSNITLTPAANHNGGTHTVTVAVSDGKGGSASDTFNLNVIAQNDAPIITGIPNQSVKVGEFKDIILSGYSSDTENDGLTFSVSACGASLTCTFPNATTIRVAANAGVGSTVSVTVEADDGNSGTNTDTFNVSITSVVPSTTIEAGGVAHSDGDAFILSDSSTQINVNNGSGNYSYSLDYSSSDVSSLISSNATGLTIGLPSSGEFAGDYTLTITDNGDGDVITITVTRPLRLSWSTKAFLNGDSSQTLKVEGGAASTVYTLVQSGSADLIFRDDNESSITTATAENNASSYNAALIHLDSLVVADISSMDVTVQSSYDDVIETDVKVYPSSLHHFTVKNSSDEVLGSAVAILNGGEALLVELGVLTNYSTDVNGAFTVLLPDTTALSAGSSYDMSVSAAGYTSESVVLNSDNASHDVVLTEIANGITLIGNINAQGSQNLLLQAPVVTITYGDETTEIITVTATSATQSNFNHEIDFNLKSLSLLSISQADSVTVELNISNINQSQNLDILLLNNASILISRPVDTTEGSSGGGGSFIWYNLFLFAGLLLRFLLLKREGLENSGL